MIQNIPVVILSGGKSSRMGEDKSLLPFEGFDTLVEYQYHKLSQVFESVYISSKIDKFDFLQDKSALILDTHSISSPMIALEAIFKRVKSQKVFIITVDTPLVSSQTLQTLIDVAFKSDRKIIIAKDSQERLHNLCGVFDTSILSAVQECILKDIHKINYLVNKVGFETVVFKNEKQFLNLNTPSDYQKAIQINRLT
jgi:molybdopterin-guanine dinucleotide biosynthesis protein A